MPCGDGWRHWKSCAVFAAAACAAANQKIVEGVAQPVLLCRAAPRPARFGASRERLRTWQCSRRECIARAAFARGHHRVLCSNHDFADRAFAEHCRSSRNASGRMRSRSRRSWFQHSAGTGWRGPRRRKLLLRWCQSCRKADLKSRRAVRCTRPGTPVPASAGGQAGRGIIARPTCERNS